MIYVISYLGPGLIEVEKVTKIKYSSWKDYAIRWTYTVNESEIEDIKRKLNACN